MSKTTIPRGGITADAIDGTLIADDAINSEHYTDGSIDTAHIGDSQVTAAKTSGVGGANTPIFLASLGSDQSVANNTATKINFNREILDSGSKYDTGNSRFTPGETGYYVFQICSTVESAIGNSSHAYWTVFKNGSNIGINPIHRAHIAGDNMVTVFIDQATNSSDYYEAYFSQDTGSNVDAGYESGSSALSYWFGYKLIS